MNLQDVAEMVVTKSLRLGAGDHVLIETWEHTIPMAEALAAACYRAGAIPVLTLSTDGLFRVMFSDLPDTLLRRPLAPMLAAYDHFTATIALGGPKDPAVFDDAVPAKMAAYHDAEKPLWDKGRERKMRGAWIEFGYATPERAQRYGVDFPAWEASITDALSMDPSELAAVGGRLASVLHVGTTLHVTGPGTDLTVTLVGRHPHIEDGVVDEQDLAVGNRYTALPTGSVTVAPQETSANGTVTFPFAGLWGKMLTDLRWTFTGGRLTAFSALENEDTFRRFWESATGDRDRLGSLAIGINPRGKAVSRGIGDWYVEGAVSLALGGNKDLGGELESSLHWSATLPAPRVEIDGRLIAEDGRVLV